jgi:exosome complex component RRP45
LGGVPLDADEVLGVVAVAVDRAKELDKLVEGALAEDWKVRKKGVEVR